MGLTELNDQQLINLFMATNRDEITARGTAVLTELMRRGIFFDVQRRDFITRFDWKLRYAGDEPPRSAEYLVYLQRYAKKLREMPRRDAG